MKWKSTRNKQLISMVLLISNPSNFAPISRRRFSTFSPKMALNNCTLSINSHRKLPILLFDVMDTIVRDPFYHDVPAFFRMSFKELIDSKHPTAWIEFEEGQINEMELAKKFFRDGRPFDLEGRETGHDTIIFTKEKFALAGLKNCMQRGYSYIEGVEELLCSLKQNGYEMHAFTNYPIWYKLIEDKLKLSTYLSWTFCSCTTGKRKPDQEFYRQVLKHLDVNAASCIFIDDRTQNVDAATEVGIVGLQFKNAAMLRQDLSVLGILADEKSKKQDHAEFE